MKQGERSALEPQNGVIDALYDSEQELAVTELLNLSGVAVRLRKPAYLFHQFQGSTNDCGPTSLAIAANTLAGVPEWEGALVAQDMDRIGLAWRAFPFVAPSRIPGWATFPWGMVHHLRKRGIRARWGLCGTAGRLQRNLLDDRITIVVVGEPLRWKQRKYHGWAHIKLTYGYAAGRGFLFVDPAVRSSGKPDGLERHGLSWHREEDFLRQWGNMLRTYVEVG